VLSNYSHEQLTPLNSFLNNSQTLLQDLNEAKEDIRTKLVMFINKIIDYFALPVEN
jgi:hypothetical protein